MLHTFWCLLLQDKGEQDESRPAADKSEKSKDTSSSRKAKDVGLSWPANRQQDKEEPKKAKGKGKGKKSKEQTHLFPFEIEELWAGENNF